MDKRVYADRREYLSKATNIRRLRMKKKLVGIKGGVCQVCGYSRCLVALDFHHIDESTKEFELSQRSLTRNWEKIVVEAKKCLLVCANCHREIHAGIVVLDKIGGILVK
jgi:predicted HNH restriction endonuclease